MNNSKKTIKNKTSRVFALWLLVLVLSAAVLLSGCNSAQDSSNAIKAGEALVIPVSDVSETAQFYPVNVEGTELEIVAVKASDGSIRTAFNTCQVCFDSGRGYYKQQGNVLVCQNCRNQFAMDQVEIESGGCNPWPIFDDSKTVSDSAITISYEFLKESKNIFLNWKTAY